MPRVLKNAAGADPDAEPVVTVIEKNPATETVTRYRFTVVEKNRSRFRRRKDVATKEYGGGAHVPDDGGLCAGEVLRLDSAFKVVSGHHASGAAHAVPDRIEQALVERGADEVTA